MAELIKGFVYILTNKSFRDDWVKIGKSSRPVDIRSKELDNTAVPLPFDIYATMQTTKFAEIEKIIHKQIDRLTDLRIRQNREFFNVHPAQALDLLIDLAAAIDDAVICQYVDGEPHQIYPAPRGEKAHRIESAPHTKRECQRERFRFSMIGLTTGDKVIFDPQGWTVKVADDNRIEYEGRLWTLSAFTGTFMPDDKRNSSNSYQGPKYFSYNGKTLLQIRLEKESEEK